MKECPVCKEDNMSKAIYCCMCGKKFDDINKPSAFRPIGQNVPREDNNNNENKSNSRFKPI